MVKLLSFEDPFEIIANTVKLFINVEYLEIC